MTRLLLALLLLASPSWAATWYVDARGNDANDGRSETDLSAAVPRRGPFRTLGQGIASATNGDVIRIASGTYDAPDNTGWVITEQLRIIGEPGVILRRTDATRGPILDLQPAAGSALQNLTLEQLRLQRQTPARAYSPGDHGIRCVLAAAPRTKLTNLVLDRVTIVGTGDTGIYFKGNTGPDVFFIFPTFRNVTVQACYRRGIHFDDGGFNSEGSSNMLFMESCYVKDCQYEGMILDQCLAASLVNSAFENNCLDKAGISPTLGAQLRLRTSHNVSITGCDFEAFTDGGHPTAKKAIVAENSRSLTISSCNFANGSETDESTQRCIKLHASAAADLHTLIGPCSVTNVRYFLEVVGDARKVAYYEPFRLGGSVPMNTVHPGVELIPWK